MPKPPAYSPIAAYMRGGFYAAIIGLTIQLLGGLLIFAVYFF